MPRPTKFCCAGLRSMEDSNFYKERIVSSSCTFSPVAMADHDDSLLPKMESDISVSQER